MHPLRDGDRGEGNERSGANRQAAVGYGAGYFAGEKEGSAGERSADSGAARGKGGNKKTGESGGVVIHRHPVFMTGSPEAGFCLLEGDPVMKTG